MDIPATGPPAELPYPGKLFTVASVVWATVIGSPLAGGILLARNHDRMGERDKGKQVLWLSAGVTAALFALAYLTPTEWKLPNSVFAVPSILAMHQIAKTRQGALIAAHRAGGGKVQSTWVAVGIGVVTLVAVVLAIVVVGYLIALPQTKV